MCRSWFVGAILAIGTASTEAAAYSVDDAVAYALTRNPSPAAACEQVSVAEARTRGAEGMDEGKAIRIAIAKSKEWARMRSARVRQRLRQ
jgi:hypothetical protein